MHNTILFLALAGCGAVSHADSVVPDPEVATADVVLALSGAEDAERPEAIAAWITAHTRFEEQLEPLFRTRCGTQPTVAMEYAFGRVRHAIDSGQPRTPPIEALRAQLGEALDCLSAEPG